MIFKQIYSFLMRNIYILDDDKTDYNYKFYYLYLDEINNNMDIV